MSAIRSFLPDALAIAASIGCAQRTAGRSALPSFAPENAARCTNGRSGEAAARHPTHRPAPGLGRHCRSRRRLTQRCCAAENGVSEPKTEGRSHPDAAYAFCWCQPGANTFLRSCAGNVSKCCTCSISMSCGRKPPSADRIGRLSISTRFPSDGMSGRSRVKQFRQIGCNRSPNPVGIVSSHPGPIHLRRTRPVDPGFPVQVHLDTI